MSAAAANKTFHYAPLLKFDRSITPGGNSAYYAARYASSTTPAGADIWWQVTRAPIGRTCYRLERVARGDWLMAVTVRGGASAAPPRSNEDAKKLTVRGYPADMVEMYFNDDFEPKPWRFQSDRDLRITSWSQPGPDGTRVGWSVSNHSKRYTEEQTIEILNAMTEIPK